MAITHNGLTQIGEEFYKRALELLWYDSSTGYFRYKKRGRYSKKRGMAPEANDVAGYEAHGYIMFGVSVDGKQKRISLHVLAFYAMTGRLPKEGHQTDHINGDKADNRFSNLREVCVSGNNRNVGKRRNSTSPWKYVSKHGKGLQARVRDGERMKYLGTFPTQLQAAWAGHCFASSLHKEHYCNPPMEAHFAKQPIEWCAANAFTWFYNDEKPSPAQDFTN